MSKLNKLPAFSWPTNLWIEFGDEGSKTKITLSLPPVKINPLGYWELGDIVHTLVTKFLCP